MRLQPRYRDDPCRDAVAVEVVDDRAEVFVARHVGLDLRAAEKGGGRRPDIARALDRGLVRLVQMAGADERYIVAAEAVEPRLALRGLDRPIPGLGGGGRFEEERLVHKPGELAPASAVHRRVEPGRLFVLLLRAAADQQRVEADEPPPPEIDEPAIVADLGAPLGEPRRIDRLFRVAGVADIVVA